MSGLLNRCADRKSTVVVAGRLAFMYFTCKKSVQEMNGIIFQNINQTLASNNQRYTEGLGALCAACDATRWDKEQTNIRAALSNPDQSVCQGPDKPTGRRGQREVEGVGCGDWQAGQKEGSDESTAPQPEPRDKLTCG
ncbi:Ankyrin repeat and MYND domain containing protein 1 [Dissostichus eleginoides]|uniref:Ankyrin repeat and MYND domain containing protein 1 n=1 Tax=Dissostichus eleginoides TaxID=100907 RepID=A0AAD9F7S8_DISEL|nr:Ankyrin repeat and MYND domain containing protein 1 [Dissostichus eleginoides]